MAVSTAGRDRRSRLCGWYVRVGGIYGAPGQLRLGRVNGHQLGLHSCPALLIFLTAMSLELFEEFHVVIGNKVRMGSGPIGTALLLEVSFASVLDCSGESAHEFLPSVVLPDVLHRTVHPFICFCQEGREATLIPHSGAFNSGPPP